MTGPLEVETSARLHLGFFDLNGRLGRRFGSLGLSLDRPVLRLEGELAERMRVEGPEAERIGRFAAKVMGALGCPRPLHIRCVAALPAHAGLGSGTQLALATAALVRRLNGLASDVRADAALLDRGGRSGVGVGLFETGGLVADGGRGAEGGVPPILARFPWPEAWRVILVLDPAARGIHGSTERLSFLALDPMPDIQVGALCRLVLMGALPAIAEGDLAGFGEAVTQIQEIVGDHFAPAQGGRFSSPAVSERLQRLLEAGAAGVGQSSWGPTGFAFAPDEDSARRLIAATAGPSMDHLSLVVAGGLNHGARIGAAVTRHSERAARTG